MGDETENEEIVIEHWLDGPPDSPKHVHHNREVTCKKGIDTITLEPMLKAQGDKNIGHDARHTYVRTTDVDSFGRAIFRGAF